MLEKVACCHNPRHVEARMRNVIATSLLMLLGCTLMSQALGQLADPVSTEDMIISHVDKDLARAMVLLEELVNINSGTMNLEGVRAVGDHLAPEFSELGFDVEWIDGAPFGRAGHLVAHRDGSGPGVLLIGHLDTVFPVDSPFQKFEIVDEHFARGPGTTDMKGGNIVIIHALRALHAADVLDDLSIRVIITGDEERSGRPRNLRAAALIEAGVWADYAIGFEDGDGDPATAVISRRGASGWTLSVTGTRAHSSLIFQPEYGPGAIYEAARILDEFHDQLSTEENLTFNPGVILGGSTVDYDAMSATGTAFGKSNVISDSVTVVGDIRAVSPEQLEFARQKMREIVADHLPMTDATIEFDQGNPPMAPTDGNRRLLEMFSRVSQDLGYGPVEAVHPRNAGAADISHIANEVEMGIDGLGLMGSGAHTLSEAADLRSMGMQTKRVAVLLYRLSQLQ
jgi:glutamate carboxypeptidase